MKQLRCQADVVAELYASIVKRCAEPSGEVDCLGKPMAKGATFVHGRYFKHLNILEDRGLINYYPAHTGWFVTLKRQ